MLGDGSATPARGRGRGAGRRRPDGHAQAPRRPTPSGARRVGARRPAGPAARAIPPHAPPRRAERHAKLAKNDDLTTNSSRKTAAFLCEHGDHRARPGEIKRRWRRCEPTGCGFVVRSSFLASFSRISSCPTRQARRLPVGTASNTRHASRVRRARLRYGAASPLRPLRRHRRPDFGERLRLAEPGALPRRARPPHGRRLANRPRGRRLGIAGGAGRGAAPRPALRPSGTRGRPPGPRPRGGRPRRRS